MEINRLLTPYNYSNGLESRIKYIVIHYVGATGGAKANCEYYASNLDLIRNQHIVLE